MSEKKLPAEWQEQAGFRVADPDGWRGEDAKPWSEPITWEEFTKRAMRSTVDFGFGGIKNE
jgi:hypothetical protein